MRVAAFTGLSGPDNVTVQDTDAPSPEGTEVVLDVEACSLNRHDLWILEGASRMVEPDDLPFVSGLDVAGAVTETGNDVEAWSAGDRVVLCPNRTCSTCRYCREGPENLCERFSLFHGGLAEQALVRSDRLIALPDSVDTTTAAALPTAYMTAYHMLRRAETGPGDLVFVPGATGGVGVAAVQLVDELRWLKPVTPGDTLTSGSRYSTSAARRAIRIATTSTARWRASTRTVRSSSRGSASE